MSHSGSQGPIGTPGITRTLPETIEYVERLARRHAAALVVANECLPDKPGLTVNKVFAESIVRRDGVNDGYQSWSESGFYRITIDCQVVPPQRSAEEIGGIQGEVGPSGPKAQQVAESEVGE